MLVINNSEATTRTATETIEGIIDRQGNYFHVKNKSRRLYVLLS